MRSRCGRSRFELSTSRVQMLRLAVLVGGLLLTAGCGTVEHAGAVYDTANHGSHGDFSITGINGSGGVALPSEMKYQASPDNPERTEPIREWIYRYRWVGLDGKSYVSDLKPLGTNPDGSAVCRLVVRPSEVPELKQAWNTGAPLFCTCEVYARFKTLDGKNDRTYDIPIPVTVTPGDSLAEGRNTE